MNFLEHIQINPTISMEKGKEYPFIEMANVSTRNREPSSIDIKAFSAGVKFEDGDTVIARIEPCLQNGKRFMAKNIGKGFGSTEFLVFRPEDESVDRTFLYYFMQTEYIKKSMIGSMTGSTGRQRVNNDIFKTMKIEIPSIEIQKKIGQILSSYDDLIENNQKQIKLLEEAAQRLYKEWFVNLRFPGYESTEFVDGLPKGWNYKPLYEIFEYVRGKSYTSKELVENGGTLMVNLKNIRAFGGYNRNAEKHFIGKYSDAQKLSAGDIVMGVTDMTQERRLVGHVAIIPDFGENVTFSMDLIKLIPIAVKKSYLYASMQFGGYSNKISPLANGTNVLHLKPEAMMNMMMLVPTQIDMEQYDAVFEPYRQKIELLQNQCDIAIEARDRLLPKLMSGEIEV